MKYLVVENRKNETLNLCKLSASEAGIDLDVIDGIDPGSSFKELSDKYVHYSTNSVEFELICFRRYFLLLDYVTTNSIDEFVLLDSDVLVFKGIEEYIKSISLNKEFVGSYVSVQSDIFTRISPHVSYWKIDALKDFVGFILECYGSESYLNLFSGLYNKILVSGRLGGVSDMTLIYLWSKSRNFEGSSAAIVDGCVADHNVTSPDNGMENEFRSVFGVKSLFVKSDVPYAKTRKNELVKFVLIHFQGQAKRLMPIFHSKKYFLFICGLYALGAIKSARRVFLRIRKSC